jgi:DNA-binding response OmpR family regulator
MSRERPRLSSREGWLLTAPSPVVLLVVAVRHPLAEYLRGCGFTVFEAANGDEARRALQASLNIEIVLADMSTDGSGFFLRKWIKDENLPVEVILAGSVGKAVQHAGDLCTEGPALAKPYDHRLVLEHIRQILARRDRGQR